MKKQKMKLHCINHYYCEYNNICEYNRTKQKMYKIRKRLRDFLVFKFGIHLGSLESKWIYRDLSGTTICHHHVSRNYSCFDCKYSRCDTVEIEMCCTNEDYINNKFSESNIPGKRHCKFFSKDEYADDYNKETGEYI